MYCRNNALSGTQSQGFQNRPYRVFLMIVWSFLLDVQYCTTGSSEAQLRCKECRGRDLSLVERLFSLSSLIGHLQLGFTLSVLATYPFTIVLALLYFSLVSEKIPLWMILYELEDETACRSANLCLKRHSQPILLFAVRKNPTPNPNIHVHIRYLRSMCAHSF